MLYPCPMYLIDGYNLLYQTELERREELVEKINAFCKARNKTALVVFDGFSPVDLSLFYVEVIFADDADKYICAIIQNNDNPSALIVVSSDNEILAEARKNKVRTVKSEEFYFDVDVEEKIPDDENPDFKISDDEVSKLLHEFERWKKTREDEN
jgi:predicted RNA-binding protein with PIN domain